MAGVNEFCTGGGEGDFLQYSSLVTPENLEICTHLNSKIALFMFMLLEPRALDSQVRGVSPSKVIFFHTETIGCPHRGRVGCTKQGVCLKPAKVKWTPSRQTPVSVF